jgi:electron transfer flavoprotein alpha subunit
MAGRKPTTPSTVTQVQSSSVNDAATQRALDRLTTAVQDLQAKGSPAVVISGSRSGGDALVSLLAALSQLGLITDETTT